MARQSIKKIRNDISALLDQMLNISSMLRGSYGVAYRRCGKPNCRCSESDSKAHPFSRISWTEKGKQHTRNIPEQDRGWIKHEVENYKLFRKNKRIINSLQNKLSDHLFALEQEVIKRTRKKRDYLS